MKKREMREIRKQVRIRVMVIGQREIASEEKRVNEKYDQREEEIRRETKGEGEK